VIADQVASSGDFSCEFRALANEPADHKKRGFGVVFIEKIEEGRRDRGVWAIVKRQR
jgi:hypothetical protein